MSTATPVPIATTPRPAAVTLRWYGHSTFLITSSQGTKILTDPMPTNMGYDIKPIDGVDIVTIGHEHSDHNNTKLATGNPIVLRGLAGREWATVDQKVKDVTIRNVPTFHDNSQGTQRGKNSAFAFELDGLRIVHLSDLGHILSQEQAAAIGPVDVLLIPVGGFYTIDGAQATQVVQQLSPKIVVPMHYKTPRLSTDWPGTGVEPFLEGKKVDRPNNTTITISKTTLPQATTVVVLNYE